jgi:predicted MFS family arabinose efflux permease
MQKRDYSIIRLLSIFTLTRLVISTAFRMVYPFLPALSRGLGVPLVSVALAISARSALGFLGPIFGAVSDVSGRKKALVIALFISGFSLVAIGLFPNFLVFFIGLLIFGGAAVVIDSSVHAYLGDRVPYAQRGSAAAIVELGWSLAFVIGIPIVGWLMAQKGWNFPFLWMGFSALLVGGLIICFVPELPPVSSGLKQLKVGLKEILKITPMMGLLLAMVMVIANQLISIVFGVWLEQAYHLRLEELGAASSVIGFAGIAGVFVAMGLTDKLGKRRALFMGLLLNSLSCLALPLVSSHLWSVIGMLFVFYLTFEFNMTSLLPLMSSLSVQARGAFMAATLAMFSLGDSVGTLLGPLLFQGDILRNALGAIMFNFIGIFLLKVFVKPVEISQEKVTALEVL